MRRTFSGSSARHCEASTSRTCDVPMPNATAPNAPCVEVWLSPHAIVIPGCVSPSSGPMTWTMPCDPLVEIEQRYARLAAVALERREHVFGHDVHERPPLIARRHDVVDRRDRAARDSAPSTRAPAACRTPAARDLVHQMQPDEELRLPVRELPDGMRVPDFLQQGLQTWPESMVHEASGIRRLRGSGLGFGSEGSGTGQLGPAGQRLANNYGRCVVESSDFAGRIDRDPAYLADGSETARFCQEAHERLE